MTVARQVGSPGTTVTDSDGDGILNDEVVGHNTRPTQLGATLPTSAQNGGEFFAVGYTAGCGDAGSVGNTTDGCTGLTTTGGVFKRIYVDGVFCNYGDGICRYGYYQYAAVSSGTNHTLQMQRNVIGGTATWRAWHNGSLIHSRTSLLMSSAFIGMGAETGTELDFTHQAVNAAQNSYNGIRYHRNGAASASPPGTTNYSDLLWSSITQPHAPSCGASRNTTTAGGELRFTALRTTGTC